MSGDASVRRSIQDLVLSTDRNVKIDPEVEDTNLSIFIDSVTNFGCRLAKHRGARILEVRDLRPPSRYAHFNSALCISPGQLVLYALPTARNHNIRIPGYASDLTPIVLSQTGVAPRLKAHRVRRRARKARKIRIVPTVWHRWHRPSERRSLCRRSLQSCV
ncbi:hypothetical protein EDB85DRAFT_963597 [Lactarius pseudohatsudake]|nr:hypothetical protein EDB85DRAFT_963597 [Lactarius pseudohatsudake]